MEEITACEPTYTNMLSRSQIANALTEITVEKKTIDFFFSIQ